MYRIIIIICVFFLCLHIPTTMHNRIEQLYNPFYIIIIIVLHSPNLHIPHTTNQKLVHVEWKMFRSLGITYTSHTHTRTPTPIMFVKRVPRFELKYFLSSRRWGFCEQDVCCVFFSGICYSSYNIIILQSFFSLFYHAKAISNQS